MYLNKCIFGGFVTRDPEIRHTRAGGSFTNFGLKVKWGQLNTEETVYLDVRVFGRLANTVYAYVKKGTNVFAEGRIQMNTWEAADGQKRHSLRLIATEVVPLQIGDFSSLLGSNELSYADETEVMEEMEKED